MCHIAPFKALRPAPGYAEKLASPPYDVLNREEAREMARDNAYSFLHVTRSEIDLPADMHPYSAIVYEKAGENMRAMMRDGILVREEKPCYYIYRLTMDGRSQTGLVCVSSVDDYEQGIIRKHEFTRPEKEQDRIRHITITGAQTGNVFLAYPKHEGIDKIVMHTTSQARPAYDFTAADGIRHEIWVVGDNQSLEDITRIFHEEIPCTYIADGHHRAASAAKVRSSLGEAAPEGADWFLTTLFPSDQLHIMDYNRVVRDLNGMQPDELLSSLKADFYIEERAEPVKPQHLHEFGMYVAGKWYLLRAREGTHTSDPIGVLDVTILTANILEKWLGITDQRTDKRIDFVGGIRGLKALEERVNSGEMAVAFSLYPVGILQLFAIADSGQVMPPKSTWFEPKLRDGLLTHLIGE